MYHRVGRPIKFDETTLAVIDVSIPENPMVDFDVRARVRLYDIHTAALLGSVFPDAVNATGTDIGTVEDIAMFDSFLLIYCARQGTPIVRTLEVWQVDRNDIGSAVKVSEFIPPETLRCMTQLDNYLLLYAPITLGEPVYHDNPAPADDTITYDYENRLYVYDAGTGDTPAFSLIQVADQTTPDEVADYLVVPRPDDYNVAYSARRRYTAITQHYRNEVFPDSPEWARGKPLEQLEN